MDLLKQYLRKNWRLVFIALGLATVNQVFSLLDPWITGNIVDEIIIPIQDLGREQFFKLALYWLGFSVGATMISRLAKNIQDYVTNVIIQKTGASIYNDGLQHALKLPYGLFEDQRSGETLSILQKVRTDIERLINNGIGLFFTGLVTVIFVFVYALSVSPMIALVFFVAIFVIGLVSAYFGKHIKRMQKTIVKETHWSCRGNNRITAEYRIDKEFGLGGTRGKTLEYRQYENIGTRVKENQIHSES